MAFSIAHSSASARCSSSGITTSRGGVRSSAVAAAAAPRATPLRVVVAAVGGGRSQALALTSTSSTSSISSSGAFAAPLRTTSSGGGRRAVACNAADPSSSGAPEGQITSELMASMQAKIADALEAQSVTVTDVYGDGRHVSIDVVAAAFEGKNAVARQRLVYKAIWMELQEAVHAVDAMSTKTPDEAAAGGGK